jgi:hypothetical protein
MLMSERARLVLVALLVTLGVAVPIGAEATATGVRPDSPVGQRARCDLRDPNLSPHNEWGRCLTVTARLSHAPERGENATLSYEIRAAVPRPNAKVSVELPDTLTFVRLPADATLAGTRAGYGVGPAALATQRRDLAPDEVERFSTSVRAVDSGPVEIVVRVTAARPDGGTDAAADRVFLTVGGARETSRLGIDSPSVGTTVRAASTIAVASSAPYRPVPEAQRPHDKRGSANPLAAVCASGAWSYVDSAGVTRASENFAVQIWDVDSAGGDDLLTFGFTGGGGRFRLCYDNIDADEGGLVDPSVRFVASNSRWRIRNTAAANNTYGFAKPARQDQSADIDFGNQQPGDAGFMRIVQAFDAVSDFWGWIPSSCWDGNDTGAACRQIVVNWTSTSTDGTYYSLVNNDVHLAAADPDSRHTVIHEAAHAVMDDVYEDSYPPSPNCSPHFIASVSSPGCAWTEGFAEWVPASVLDDPFYRWPDGGELPLETPTWGTPFWDNGIAVEGRVAGAMIDIEDIANESFWDRWAEGGPPRPQWTTFLNGTAPTYYVHFAQDRASMGFNVDDTGAAGSVYQNTIDIGFEDPLGNYTELTRPAPTPHRYGYHTTSPFWSALAIRPSAGSDYDLELYDNPHQGTLLGQSSLLSDVPDYVMVDSNRRPLGDYHAEVPAAGSSGRYQVELAQGVDALLDGSQTVSMNAGDVITVRDTLLEAGVPTFFRVAPSNAGQDPELLLHAQTAGTTSPVQGRAWAVAAGSGAGPGRPEALSHTSPAREWEGLVLVNKAGSGTYTLYRDTTPPTGSALINGGAASTTARRVRLRLAAADDQTGANGVQISVDGRLDSEPMRAFSARRDITLPAGSGTKTVLVRYRNRAGMLSQTVRDTIRLRAGRTSPR